MSGGIAYVWDQHNDFITRCNLGMVELERVAEGEDVAELLELIELHHQCTGSTLARRVLDQWPGILEQFVKVMPVDYKRVLMERRMHDEEIETPVHGVPNSG
jgi:glutamate synthase domain-containing protein 3